MLATRAYSVAGARRLVALLVIVLVCGIGTLISASPASAHAFLADSNPADGSVLNSAPPSLRLEFSESVLVSATRVDIVDSDGTRYVPTNLRIVESGDSSDTEQPVEVVADLPALPRSTYRVSWETISTDDLHRTSGVIVFGIATPVKAAGATEPTPKPDEATIRWAMFALLSLAMGGLATAMLFRRQGTALARAAARRTLRIAAVGGGLALVSAVALLVDQLIGGGLGLRQVLFSSYGARWTIREAGLASLAAAAVVGYRWPRLSNGFASGLAGVGAVLACTGSAMLGHSGAGKPLSITRVAADALHLAAASTWSGLLLAGVLVAAPLLRSGGAPAAVGRQVLRRFGTPAAACLTVMLVTGVYLASDVVGSVDAAMLTVYGRVLLVKLALVALAAVIGLLNHVRLRRNATPAKMRRSLLAECAAVLVVLGLAATLTSGQPAREPKFISIAASVVPVVDGGVADLQEALAVRPNQPGRNAILVDVFDTRRPSPAPVRSVTVTVLGLDGSRSRPIQAQSVVDGRWSAPAEIASQGRVHLLVEVSRPGLPVATRTFSWTVGGTVTATRRATISMAPIHSALRTSALAACLGCLALWTGALAVRRRRRRRSASPSALESRAGNAEFEVADGLSVRPSSPDDGHERKQENDKISLMG